MSLANRFPRKARYHRYMTIGTHSVQEPVSAHDQALSQLMRRAGHEALAHFGQVYPSTKPDGSPVTEADRIAEQILVQGLQAAYPDDAIIGEEGTNIGMTTADAGTWYIDPIDGTGSFLEGLAHWGPCIGRLLGDSVHCGASFFPRLDEYYFVQTGVGAFRNGQPLPNLKDGPIHEQDVIYLPSRFHQRATLTWPGKARNLGSTAAHLALVAAGAARAAIIPGGWSIWDTACGLGLIHQVGGIAQTPDGATLHPAEMLRAHRSQPFIAGTRSAVEWLIANIQLRTPGTPPHV